MGRSWEGRGEVVGVVVSTFIDSRRRDFGEIWDRGGMADTQSVEKLTQNKTCGGLLPFQDLRDVISILGSKEFRKKNESKS